jgi:hypothetical protein
MKLIRLSFLAVAVLITSCSNLPPDDAASFKAYPNPYNPAAGNLTLEKTSGIFSSTDHHDLVVLDYNLTEIYRTTATVTTTNKISWPGIDSGGTKVAPGVYYLKVISNTTTGVEGADSMFKLIVQ